MKLVVYKQEFNELTGKIKTRQREFYDIFLIEIIKDEQTETSLNISMYNKKDMPINTINNDKIDKIIIT